jgi:hypothetical protein
MINSTNYEAHHYINRSVFLLLPLALMSKHSLRHYVLTVNEPLCTWTSLPLRIQTVFLTFLQRWCLLNVCYNSTAHTKIPCFQNTGNMKVMIELKECMLKYKCAHYNKISEVLWTKILLQFVLTLYTFLPSGLNRAKVCLLDIKPCSTSRSFNPSRGNIYFFSRSCNSSQRYIKNFLLTNTATQ